jgi:hypothetical protein
VDVEPIGIGKAPLVAVRGREEHVDTLTGHDRDAGELGVANATPRDQDDRGLPSESFLDRHLAQLGLARHRGELLGVREEPEQEVPERAVRGLDPGGEQEPQEGEDLVVGEPFAVDLGLGELADEIVARMRTPFLELFGEVRAERLGCGEAALPVDDHADELERPLLELCARRVREARGCAR